MTAYTLTRRQWIVRLAWFAIFFLQAVVFVAGMSIWFTALHQVCNDTALACQQRNQLSPTQWNDLAVMGWSPDGYAWYNLITHLIQKLLGITIGLLIFWRKPDDRMAWVASVFLIIGLAASGSDVLADAQPLWWVPTRILALLGSMSFALFFYLFPGGTFVPRWTRWFAFLWTLVFAGITFFPDTILDINKLPVGIFAIIAVILFSSFIVAQAYRYWRVSSATERLQTKWVFAAMVVGIAGILLGTALVIGTDAAKRISPLYFVVDFSFSAFDYLTPLAVGIAIFRYRLWEIDVIIRRTATYALVTAVLALVFFGSVILLQQIFGGITGSGQNELVTVLSTLAIAALFVPLRNRIQATIDKRFNRKKYDAQQVLNEFAQTVRDETDLEKLTARLMQVVDETMQPKSVVVWLKNEKGSK